ADLWVLLQERGDERADRRRSIGTPGRQRRGLRGQDEARDREPGRLGERRRAGERFVEEGAERPEGDRRTDRVTGGLLRRHVRESNKGGCGAGERAPRATLARDLGETEVDEPHGPTAREEDVGGLHVAVDDADTVGGGERPGERDRDIDRLRERQRSAPEPLL